jgi:hypothetical protein
MKNKPVSRIRILIKILTTDNKYDIMKKDKIGGSRNMKNFAVIKKAAAAVLCSLFILPNILTVCDTVTAASQADMEKKNYYKNEASVFTKEPKVVTLGTENVPLLGEENYTLDLDGKWKMTSDGKIAELKNGNGWDKAIDATVPGSIHTALYEAGVIDDPYVGDNMKDANKYGEKNWYLKRTFNYEGAGKSVLLCFEGVCNVADFYRGYVRRSVHRRYGQGEKGRKHARRTSETR